MSLLIVLRASECNNLKEIPEMDTSNIQEFGYAFYGCGSLVSMPKLNFQTANRLSNVVAYCSKLTTIGGFENLGQGYSTTSSENYSNYKLDLHWSENLTHESLMNVINNLYDIATKGVKPQQLVLGATNLAKLTSEEIEIAQNKGWSVS